MPGGTLLIVGGAEERSPEGVILSRFIELCPGTDPVVLLIDAASKHPQRSNRKYRKVFSALGVRMVLCPRLTSQKDADNSDFLQYIDQADAVFLAGGDQTRLCRVLQQTRGIELLLERFASLDITVGGTSAGASALSKTMITSGGSGLWPRKGRVKLSTGLGFVSGFVIDQHFEQRERFGRLAEAVISLSRWQVSGLGIDENTALILHPAGRAEVAGSGGVAVIQPSRDLRQEWESTKEGGILPIRAMHLTLLRHGDIIESVVLKRWFDGATRKNNEK